MNNKQLTPQDLYQILFEHVNDKSLQFNVISFTDGCGGIDFNEYYNKNTDPLHQDQIHEFKRSYEALVSRINTFYYGK